MAEGDVPGTGPAAEGTATPAPEGVGAVVRLLLERGLIDEKQLAYARRVHARLATPRPLLHVLEELEYVSSDQVATTLREHGIGVPIGALLVELGHLSEDDVNAALAIQEEQPGRRRLGQVLVDHDFIEESTLTRVLAFQFGYACVEPHLAAIDRELAATAPTHWYVQHDFVPVSRNEDGSVVVAFSDPRDRRALEAAASVFGEVQPAIAEASSVREAIARLEKTARSVRGEQSESEIVRLADEIIQAGVAEGASDIHFEQLGDRLRVRFRCDGVLVPHRDLPRDRMAALTSRLKILCGADIVERRRHQGGRILFESAQGPIDLRASFYVTVHGEKVVLRILNRGTKLLELDEVGMPSRMRRRFVEDALERPSGVILITGPTGSGKTTTLYSCVQHLNRPDVSIITAEDPVEYQIEGIAQCSINAKIDLTFEDTLRHIVRQDPDVIVIGEIRDRFSADTAIQAALTGHKVLTTFHTEDTIGGLVRLLNMEIEAFLISSTVVSVVAQRLLRKVCSACEREHVPTPEELRRLGYQRDQLMGGHFRSGAGCARCRYTGYAGRVAVYELLVLNELVREAILDRRPTYEIRRISTQSTGLVTLLEDGIMKAARGRTTLSEAIRMLPHLERPRPIQELRRLLGE